MKIELRKKYKIKGKSPYFKKKYGIENPIIWIEDVDTAIFEGGWGVQNGNPACMLFALRSGVELLPDSGLVYYGKIYKIEAGMEFGLGELVHESELEEYSGK